MLTWSKGHRSGCRMGAGKVAGHRRSRNWEVLVLDGSANRGPQNGGYPELDANDGHLRGRGGRASTGARPHPPRSSLLSNAGMQTRGLKGATEQVILQQRREQSPEHHTWWPDSPPVTLISDGSGQGENLCKSSASLSAKWGSWFRMTVKSKQYLYLMQCAHESGPISSQWFCHSDS